MVALVSQKKKKISVTMWKKILHMGYICIKETLYFGLVKPF